MKTANCQLLREWSPAINPSGWLMSEKYDGVRLLRFPGDDHMTTREGNKVYPPRWWIQHLPDAYFIDGEAWAGRGKFSKVQKAVLRAMSADEFSNDDDTWASIQLQIIWPVSGHTVAGRTHLMLRNPVFQPIKYAVCSNLCHLSDFYLCVRDMLGEGVVIRHPDYPYHTGRSGYLLKIKERNKP